MRSFELIISGGWRKSREDFVSALVERLSKNLDFQGIVEGATSLVTRELDSVEPSSEENWLAPDAPLKIYFASSDSALKFSGEITRVYEKLKISSPHAIQNEDWNKKWRDSYKGAEIPPYWKIIPSWAEDAYAQPHKKIIRMNPSLGFGTGEHPTTQLCMMAMARLEDKFAGAEVLDFGSGSGILAVGAALLRAKSVDAIEIDEMALESSQECARLNHMSDKIRFATTIPSNETYQIVIANILRNVLLDFGPRLMGVLRPDGLMILSGLLEDDAREIRDFYAQLWLEKFHCEPQISRRQIGDWFSLVIQDA